MPKKERDAVGVHVENVKITGYEMNKEQAQAIIAIADALGKLAEAAKGPTNVTLGTGIHIENA